MNKMVKGFAFGLVIVLIALVPACRSSRKKAAPATTTTQAVSTVPEVPVTATTASETKVDTQPPDFVTSEKPSVEPLPTDIDQLNRTVQERGMIRDAFFAFDESTLGNDAQSALTGDANWLKQNAQYNVLIEGHCDERGTEQYNLALGDRRASIVRDYLVTLGVDAGRIRTVSYGEERPFAEGHNETAWSQNRRAHVVLLAPGQTR